MIHYGYDSYQDPRLQPPEEREPTPAEALDECVHKAACMRLLEMVEGPIDTDRFTWEDELAARMGCGACECWGNH